MIGTHFVQSSIQHIYVKNSNCEYVDFAENKIRVLELEKTNLHYSNWFENDIKDIEFNENNLKKSTIYNNPFHKLDLSTCEIDELRIDIPSLKGLTIAQHQAVQFCHLLGIRTK